MLQFGKLYRLAYDEDMMVSTNNGWKFIDNSIMFMLLREEKEHYVVLLPNGVLGNIYTNEGSFKLVTKDSL